MFWWKKMTPKLVVLQVVKKLQVLEKKIFSKKILGYLISAEMIFKTVCGTFLRINGS